MNTLLSLLLSAPFILFVAGLPPLLYALRRV